MKPAGTDDSTNTRAIATPALPQIGFYLDQEWAAAFQQDVKTFRDRVRRQGVPYRAWGSTMIVEASEFWAHLPVVKAEGGGE